MYFEQSLILLSLHTENYIYHTALEIDTFISLSHSQLAHENLANHLYAAADLRLMGSISSHAS